MSAELESEASSKSEEPVIWQLLDSGTCAWDYNMALDEALLERGSQLGIPVLRFYGWNEPAASFGYFQRISEIETITQLRPLVRRPTGGGLVPHDSDWTYSVAIPTSDPWYSISASASYQRMHEWIRAAFAQLGTDTELAPCCNKAGPGQCFLGYEKFDLLWRGKKIAGAAQRRTRIGMLIQGSVQAPPMLEARRQEWQKAMCEAARFEKRVVWQNYSADKELAASAERLAREKYSQAAYNRKR